MALNKRQYTDGQTIITAANLNEIQDCIITLEGNYVPKTRTVAGKALSSNITLAASDVGAVPTSRTINSKALSSNITLSAADVGAVPVSRTVNSKALSSNITLNYADVGAVPSTRTVNGKALSDDISITASDIGAVPTSRTINSKALTSNITLSAADVSAVPTTRTVNSKALSSDITLTAADVSAVPTTRTVNSKALSSDITLTSDDIGYNSSTTYTSGSVGEAVSDLNGAIGDVSNGLTDEISARVSAINALNTELTPTSENIKNSIIWNSNIVDVNAATNDAVVNVYGKIAIISYQLTIKSGITYAAVGSSPVVASLPAKYRPVGTSRGFYATMTAKNVVDDVSMFRYGGVGVSSGYPNGYLYINRPYFSANKFMLGVTTYILA